MAAAELTRPRPARTRALAGSDMLRAWLIAYAVLWGFTLAAAVVICVLPGGPALAQGLLRLPLTAAHNPPPSVARVVSIATNNTLHSVWPLSLGLLDTQRRAVTRTLADAAVLANLFVGGLLVGSALASYTTRSLPFLPHVPVEWAGLGLGAAGWLVERRRPIALADRARWIALVAFLLLCSAVFETYLVPHR